jgi:hypothetical protein
MPDKRENWFMTVEEMKAVDALTLAKKLAVLARIYALGLLKEVEYTKVKNKIMQEHNVVTFEQM